MKKKFKFSLLLVFIIVGALIIFSACYFFIDRNNNEAIVIVDGQLSINFLKGNKFNNKNNQEMKFTVVNNSEELIYYYISFNDITGSGSYTLTGLDNDIYISDSIHSGTISSFIEVKSGEIHNYTVKFTSNNSYSGTINIHKEAKNYDTFADIILKSYQPKEEYQTQLGSLATENEGLNIAKDDSGTTYFFRGNIDNNYVKFAGYDWRIVRINGDGSVRLVLNNLLSDSKYYLDGEDYHFDNTQILASLNDFYNEKLRDYADFISTNNFCSDVNIEGNGFANYNRILVDKIISYKCLGEKYTTTIGLLTIDEVVGAGASVSEDNTSYYLYSSQIDKSYYTMSAAKNENDLFYPFIINHNGGINYSLSGIELGGVRPVVNIIKNVTVSGSGIIDDPYVIKSIDSN